MVVIPERDQQEIVSLPANYEEMDWIERKKVREQYVIIQGGKCQFCGAQLDGQPSAKVRAKKVNSALFPRSFFKHPVHLHHDHNTGLTIGAVHNHCNAVLWQYHGE